jgi:tetratricopeptide (TPR) repeat protein
LYLLRDPSVTAADSVRRLLERAFASDTTSPLIAVVLARTYLQVLERGGVNPPLTRGLALRRVDELTKFALARDPRRIDAWTTRAVAARVRDTLAFSGALDAHAKALAITPRSADAVHELAMTFIALGQDADAASALRQSLALEPERGSSLQALADIELRARRYREACAYSNAAVAAAPFNADAYAVRARARLQLGQARDAYADAETAGKLSREAWTQGLWLLTEVSAGNYDGAAALGRQLARRFLAPGQKLTVKDAAMLSMAWIRLGDTRRGIEALTRARPRGRLLNTMLRDRAFDSVRQQPDFRALMASAKIKGTQY